MLSNKEAKIGSNMARIFAIAIVPSFLIQAFALDPTNPGYDSTWGPALSVLNVVTGFALLFVFALTTKLYGDDNNPFDPSVCEDDDNDTWSNNNDFLPADPTQWLDTDGDGYGDNPDGTDGDQCASQAGTATLDLLGCPDNDMDGWSNSGDAFPEEFELALLEMEVGSISNVIELEDTIHIIKFTELLSDELPSYEEMIDSLRKELLDLDTADRVDELLANVEDQILSGASLANLELALSSPSQITDPIEQASLQEVFDGFDNINAFYSNNFQPGDIEVVEQDDGFIVIELIEIVNPQIELFENVVEKALAEVRTTKSLVELNKVDEYAESFLKSDSDQSLPIGFNADTFKEITRNSSIVSSDVLEKVFSLQVGEYFNISSYDGSKYWVFIFEENEPREFDINEKSDLYGEYFEQFNNQRNSLLLDQKLRENLKVNIKN